MRALQREPKRWAPETSEYLSGQPTFKTGVHRQVKFEKIGNWVIFHEIGAIKRVSLFALCPCWSRAGTRMVTFLMLNYCTYFEILA